MKLQTGQTLLFIGDSITDCGRDHPSAKGSFEALGSGYVQLVAAILTATNPVLKLEIINNGISGNTTRDLKNRWNDDVLARQPDWLSIMIGTNDVWRQFDSATETANHILPEEYEKNLRDLVAQAQSSTRLQGVVLLTPFLVETSTDDAMRAKMDEYGAIVKRVATETNAIFVDTQAAYNRVLESVSASELAPDRVHPSAVGHMVLAHAFLKAVDFAWS